MLGETLDQLDTALAAGDWPSALQLAIAAWRTSRSVELADLVDRITERCPQKPPSARTDVHRWWMERAMRSDLDALAIGVLLAAFPIRMQVDTDVRWREVSARWSAPNPIIQAIAAEPPPPYWTGSAAWRQPGDEWPNRVPNWVDRLAAIVRWPDDPRITRVLVNLLGTPDAMVHGQANDRVADAMADRLRTLADQRAVEWLTRLVVPDVRSYKQQLVNRLVPTIEIPRPAPLDATDAAKLAAACARIAIRAGAASDIAALWREVAEHPEDDAPRLVLADALIAADDPRGELIGLQLDSDPTRGHSHARARAKHLMRQHWTAWMGDLALLLVRKGTEMSRGMLEKIRVGHMATPPWVWDAVREHRELGAVREVRPCHVAPDTFARFVAHLPNTPRLLGIDAPEAIEELAKLHTSFPVEEVVYAATNPLMYRQHAANSRPAFDTMYTTLARLAPDLARLELGHNWWERAEDRVWNPPPARVVEVLADIRQLFPRLERLRVRRDSVYEDAREALARVPFIEVIDD